MIETVALSALVALSWAMGVLFGGNQLHLHRRNH
jgi:hypothetical protein